jgi:hypothetical protein
VETAIGQFELLGLATPNPYSDHGTGLVLPSPTNTTLLIRPEAATLADDGGIEGILQAVSFRGRYQQAIVMFDGGVELKFELETAVSLPPVGSPIHLNLNPQDMQLL